MKDRRRDRLALWVLRRLAPDGLGGGPPLVLFFDSGWSTQANPELVMRIKVPDTNQLLVSVVVPPEYLTHAVEEFRTWGVGEAVTP